MIRYFDTAYPRARVYLNITEHKYNYEYLDVVHRHDSTILIIESCYPTQITEFFADSLDGVKAMIIHGDSMPSLCNRLRELGITDKIGFIKFCETLHETLWVAKYLSKPYDVILYSPFATNENALEKEYAFRRAYIDHFP